MDGILSTSPLYIPQSSDRQVNRAHQLQNKIGIGAGLGAIDGRILPSAEGKTLSGKQGIADPENLDEVSRQFEAIFIHQMLKAMRKTVIRSELLGSFAGEQYESMMDEEFAKEVSKHQGIGLSEVIYRQLEYLTQPKITQP